MLGDIGVVAVVARLGAQLRRAGIQVADAQVAHHERTDHRQHRSHADDRKRRPALGQPVEPLPHPGQQALALRHLAFIHQRALCGARAHADIRQRHRNQHQLGKDQHRDADAGRDGEIADHRDINDDQYRKAHDVRQQCRQSRHEQAAEGIARRHVLVRAAAYVLQDAVHLLRAVRKADGEDQERHQDRIRIQLIAQDLHQPKQPNHARDGNRHQQHGAAHTARVHEDEDRRYQHGDAKEQHHLLQSGDQVTDNLAKANNMHAHPVALEAADLGLERLGELAIA